MSNMILTQEQLHQALVERHGIEVQKKIDAGKVGIAGLGGLGSNIAVLLARMGVGHIVLVDFDVVDITNLNRQHYTMNHIGMEKSICMLEQLMEINPYINYEVHTKRILPENAAEIFTGCDIVCEAFDKADQKAMLIETLLQKSPNTYVISGNGLAGCDTANNIQVRRKIGRLYVCGDETSDIANVGGLMAPRVAVCASHQATSVLRLLLGYEP